MKRKFSLVMSAAMILSLIAPMTNALAEDIQTPETATPETVVTEDAASGGTTYYVDSTIGDDSNSGTSPETPWKSLDKVTATTFLPGDTILLKSGSVWNGEWLWPKGSGTADPGQTPQQNSDGILSGATVWDGYKLNASSPLIDAGIYVPQMGTTDFYGTQLYWGNAPDIGVHEYQQGEYNNPSNFALGKTVTSNNSHESLTPDLMVDGIYSQNSRWAAANSDLPIWLDIDFGKDTTFNKVVLTENIVSGWASPRIASFNLQIPTADGYQTIYTYDGEIGEGKDFTFDTVTASHLRMEITSLRADTSTHGRGETDPSIVEFEVYKVPVIREPQNLLLNKSVSASSSHPSCPASKVNDGDASQGSRWAAANSDLPAWLEFNLGSEQTFNSVTITENIVPNWASERITGLEFQAWNGTEYTTISTYSGTIGTSKTISLPETTSSKFKVLITGLQEDTTKNSKGQTDPSIQEIELYYR